MESKDSTNILLTEDISDRAVDSFKQAEYSSIQRLKHAPSEHELIKLLDNTQILGIRSRTQITEKVLASSPSLLGVGCFCIGTNQVDLDTAARSGVPVFNAPYSNTRSVAELTISSIIALMRGIPEKNQKAHSGEWLKSAKNSHEVRKKKLGIVGYGNIGSQLSVIASALGMHVNYFDIETKLPHGNAQAVSSLDELYKISDIVTFHVPATNYTKHMLNHKSLAIMKNGVYIINYSRESVIDVEALVDALGTGRVAGAAIDVFPEEPVDNTQPFKSPLQDFPNVLLTPHVGGSTIEAQENIGLEVAEKLASFEKYGTTLTAVNFPEISLKSSDNAVRITNVHQNVPGMLAQINAVFSDYKANIVGQGLQTKDDIGYVIIDIEKSTAADKNYLYALNNLEGSIKSRLLS